MKIVHVSPNSPYNEGWGYQENLLPKYQKKLGNEVTLIITNKMHKDGKIVEVPCEDYISDNGVRIIRMKYKKYMLPKITGVFSLLEVYPILEEIKPDIIFQHGLLSCTIFDIIKYKKKHPNCLIVEDNHLDSNIGTIPKTVKEKIIRLWQKYINKLSIKYVDKVYGVTPWRKQYAEEYYGIPANKTDVLIMGADDDEMHLDNRKKLREKIRNKYNIKEDEFLIVSGGKIDKNKKIEILMDACQKIKGVKLIIFGEVLNDVKDKFEKILSNSDNIIYVGWIKSDKVYEYFYASDLVFFPGQHSVLWEQACASKVPCVFEKWPGMNHVNNGGNSDFVDNITPENIKKKIISLKYTNKYYKMKEIAESSNTNIYLYSNIAKKSLEVTNKNNKI